MNLMMITNRDNISDIPTLPGVYLFKDDANTIIYIGKAKSLRTRVKSYFQKSDTDWKIKELIHEYAHISYIVTKSETEALLLEAQLIKDYKPRYNVLLKNGNPFLYIVFTNPTKELPRIKIARDKKEQGTYFGPFLYKKNARNVYTYLLQTFQLTLCKRTIPAGCLQYHLGYCAGNCADTFDASAYRMRLELAQQALQGNHKQYLQMIDTHIRQYNEELAFEKSAHLAEYKTDLDRIFTSIKTRYHEKRYTDDVAQAILSGYYSDHTLHHGLKKLQELLHLEHEPISIDCFDISHHQSTHIVGSCIRFTHGLPDKEKFRRFKIKSLQNQNDYAALQEIVARRYRDPKDLPDIIMIDGGKGQRNAVAPLFPDVTVISLAKRKELLISDVYPEGFELHVSTSLGKLLIALRDYAHHFAISYHRKRRHRSP